MTDARDLRPLLLRRRILLAALLLAAARPSRAQGIPWTAADADKFAAIRKGFPEYVTFSDRDFARDLLQRVRRVWLAPKPEQDEFYRTFVARLPQYDIYSWKGLHNELIRLLLTAFAHFSKPS